MTKLLNDIQREQLLANGRAMVDKPELDLMPVVKLFTPDANGTWLLSELHADGILFGLCDLGMGSPELGYVSLAELEALRGRWGLPVACDASFVAAKPLSGYAHEARLAGHILI